MTLIDDVRDTWKAYVAAFESGNQRGMAEERHELLYDLKNYVFDNGTVNNSALDALLDESDMDIARVSESVLALTLPGGEVVQVHGR